MTSTRRFAAALAAALTLAPSAFAQHDSFVGTWLNRNAASPIQQIVVTPTFSAVITSIGSNHLTTYGGASTGGVSASQRGGIARYSGGAPAGTIALFSLGGNVIVRPGQPADLNRLDVLFYFANGQPKIGRASCRERVCQYV